MTPKSHHKENDLTIFDYDPVEYAEFIRQGEETGDVGFTIKSRNEEYSIYEGFGTYEKPHRNLTTITIMRFPLFEDGPRPTDDELCQPPKNNLFDTGEWIIVDFSKGT